MTDADEVVYSRAARLRVALSHAAAEASDTARSLVPAWADSAVVGGELVAGAARLVAQAREVLALAVAYERRRGASWEDIGEALGVSRQAAHERFAGVERDLDRALVRAWLDPQRARELPSGADDPAAAAAWLDRWVRARLQATDALAHDPDPEVREHPVSVGLTPMDTLEHSTLVMTAARLLAEHDADDPEHRRLEAAYTRRRAEFERMLAEASADKTGPR